MDAFYLKASALKTFSNKRKKKLEKDGPRQDDEFTLIITFQHHTIYEVSVTDESSISLTQLYFVLVRQLFLHQGPSLFRLVTFDSRLTTFAVRYHPALPLPPRIPTPPALFPHKSASHHDRHVNGIFDIRDAANLDTFKQTDWKSFPNDAQDIHLLSCFSNFLVYERIFVVFVQLRKSIELRRSVSIKFNTYTVRTMEHEILFAWNMTTLWIRLSLFFFFFLVKSVLKWRPSL